MARQLEAPDQERIEADQRDAFRYGSITQLAREARIPYDTLVKQLNPNDTTESLLYTFVWFLYACAKVDPMLEEKVWNVLVRHRPGGMTSLEAALRNYEAVKASGATEEQIKDAKDRVVEVLARDGVKDPEGEAHKLARIGVETGA